MNMQLGERSLNLMYLKELRKYPILKHLNIMKKIYSLMNILQKMENVRSQKKIHQIFLENQLNDEIFISTFLTHVINNSVLINSTSYVD